MNRRSTQKRGKKFPRLWWVGKKYRSALLGWGLLLSIGGLGMFAGLASAEAGTVRARVIFAQEAQVTQPPVRLGDIAQVIASDPALASALAGLELSPFVPPVGQTLTYRAESLRILLRRHQERLGVDDTAVALEGAPRTEIRLRSQRVEPAALLEAVRPELEAWLNREYGAERVELSYLREPEPLEIPTGDWTAVVQTERLSGTLSDRWSVPVQVQVAGRPVETLTLALNLHAYGPIGIAKRAIHRHEALRAEDVEYVERDLTTLNGKRPLGRLVEAVGVRARRAIRAGEPFTEENVEELPLIRQGDLVTVTLEAPRFRLTMIGQALQDGRYGETIAIRNPASGKVIRGLVVQQRLARVVLPILQPSAATAQRPGRQ
ncbi:MAG: hypothetical protein KatS3mg115_2287 [Candidatus Poribacteria bacterium]|nr:MAG: hypothetical protein KatS3mg115_2287 [Candidatus Poribacteria bacterium]